MKRFIRSVGCVLLLASLLAAVFLPALAADVQGEEDLVRIGYYQGDQNFQNGFSDDVRKSGYAYEYFQKIAALTGWRYEYVYGTRVEIMEKLASGEVDLAAGVYQTDKVSDRYLFSKLDMGLDGEKRYFAVTPSRQDLLGRLNWALSKLQETEPSFTLSLRQKYYSQGSAWQALSDEERAWLTEKGTLRVGYVRNNLPLSDQGEDGQPIGVAGLLKKLISSYLSTPLESVCYDSIYQMEDALLAGEIDAAFPIYSDLWLNESKGFFQTTSFVSDRVMIVYQGSYRSDLLSRVALSWTGVGQRYYLAANYPQAQTTMYDSREEAFRALLNGSADCTVGCSSIMQRFLSEHSEFQDFNIGYLDTSEDFSIAVSREEGVLIGIMEKAVRQLDKASITNTMVQYSSVEESYSVSEFIRRNAVTVVLVLSAFFAVLLWVFISYRRKTKLFNAEQAKSRAALEEALGAAKAASEAKSTFLSSMSHDIRTPLNGIIGMTAIAGAHIDEPSRVKDCLGKITSSGKHLLALINEVLDMSKIESGEIHLNEEVFSLSNLVDDLITLNRSQADARGHEMIVHIVDIIHEEAVGDSVRLQQVFTNLVSNAIKYTPNGGTIEISLTEKDSGNPLLGCYEFIVEDNGVGMSEDYLPHLFEAFTRAENASTAKTQGTGLGMAIARNIVRMMGGDIAVESQVGVGSKFTVTFLLKLREAEVILREDFAGLHVLVIDDDQIICESACLQLSELGMKGDWALSGQEGLEKASARHREGEDYFAILVDWKMPDMDGISTTRALRAAIGPKPPIVVISSNDWSSIEVEALDAGATCFAGKPLFRSRLVHLFDELLGNKETESVSELKELAADNDFSGHRVLLAEDNDINAEIATEILQMVGLEVEWAHDGLQAVDMMGKSEKGYYDCIFMDVQMPGMNGLDATKEIRAMDHPDGAHIPIFAMTANAFLEDVQAAKAAGMNEHLAKPLNLDLLIDTLNRYLH